MKAIHQNSRITTIKFIAIIALLFFTTQQTKATCNLQAGFTYTIDTTTNIIQFNSTSTSDTSIISWRYEFGDGTPVTLNKNPAHIYPQNGNYNVCLTVIDTNNCSDTFCDVINYTATCNSNFLDYYKNANYHITKYTNSNGDIFYEIAEKFHYSN